VSLDSSSFGILITNFETEYLAWLVQSWTAQALGMKYSPEGADEKPEYQIWSKGWRAAEIETLRSKGVSNVLRDFYPDSDKDYLPNCRH
jgi:hypothetical protein